jgi:hypothetical protein
LSELELAEAWATWTGAGSADKAGASVRADADADGQDDLFPGATGAPDGSHHGGVRVKLGPVGAGAWSLADSDLFWVGETWAEAGDALDAACTDGDGAAELLAGAQEWDPVHVRGATLFLPGGVR